MVVEFDLHPHRPRWRDKVRLVREDQAGPLGGQGLLVRWIEKRENNLSLKDADHPQTPALVR